MGLFKRKKENRAGESIMSDDLLRAILSERTITKNIALQIPSIAGGIDLIANIVASTPIKLYKELDGKAEEIKDDARLRLLNDETGDTLNANDFWKAIIRDYYTGKGGFAFINRQRGRFKSIHYVDESYISINRNSDPIYKDYDIIVNGNSYKPYEFLKILRNTRDGMVGVPITSENSELISTVYETMRLEYALARKGGGKRGFFESPNRLDEQRIALLKEGFKKLYSDNQTESVLVLPNGVKFQEASATSAEMQLNENKAANAKEFAKIFHIPPEVMSGKASEADTASLAKIAAIPLMTTIQCALNRDLLLEKEKGIYYFAFDTKELLKGDIKSRFEAYKTALDANFMQIDEVRFAEDLEPLGLTWIKLGLSDVLYDPKTKAVYTPNTNKTSSMQDTEIIQSDKKIGGDTNNSSLNDVGVNSDGAITTMKRM